MGRVKIKHPRPKELASKRQLLGILSPAVKPTRLISSWDAIIVLTATDKDADNIFSPSMLQTLADSDFTPIMPPELKSRRTVVCLRLDELVYDNSPEDIKEDIESRQSWAKVVEIFKFPRSKTIKITFTTSDMARKAKEHGLAHVLPLGSPVTNRGRGLRPLDDMQQVLCRRGTRNKILPQALFLPSVLRVWPRRPHFPRLQGC